MKRFAVLLLALAMALSLPLAAHCEGTAGGTNDTALTTLSDGGLSAGVQTENSYWNDAMSIGCTFGSKWYFYTDEEIAEQNGLATGMLREDYAKLVEESGSMMDMLAGGFNLCGDIAAWDKIPEDYGAKAQKEMDEIMKNLPDEVGHTNAEIAQYRDKMLIDILKLHHKF